MQPKNKHTESLLVPICCHFILLLAYIMFNPTGNNPGAMMGAAWVWILMIVSLPTMLVLLIFWGSQSAGKSNYYKTYFTINMLVAISPVVYLLF